MYTERRVCGKCCGGTSVRNVHRYVWAALESGETSEWQTSATMCTRVAEGSHLES